MLADANEMDRRIALATPPPASAGVPGARAVVAALCVVAALIVLRAPELLIEPRFSGEEGSVYFQAALDDGALATLLTPHMDHLVLYENLAVLAAAWLVPIEHAPLVTTLAALALQLVAPAIVLASRAPVWASPWRRAAGVALLLLVRPSATVWLTTNTAAFHAAVIAFLLLLEPTAQPARRAVDRAAIVACGLTGPIASFLVPAYVHRAWHRRDRESAVQAALLAACGLAQAAALLVARTRPDGLHREVLVDAGTTGFATVTRVVVQPVLGVPASAALATWIDRVPDPAYQLAGVVLVGVLAAGLWR